MAEKIQFCLISHTHWDREWYLSHPKHNYRLVKLMDSLVEVLERDERFRSFHLDGQVILIEDYLKVRPEMRERVTDLIRSGRIKIGPFYILQDEFLVTGESTVRNALYGLKESRRYGEPVMCGYFPDAFGNVSQIPQILRGFGIDCVYFGRGTFPAGYWSEAAGKTDEGFSELNWESPDGSRVLAVQFAHWYNNAAELKGGAEGVERFNKMFELTGLTSLTPYHLGMNGCDHQPVQLDLSDVIEELNGKVSAELVQVSADEYMDKVRPYQDRFPVHRGEITGQNGIGYNTLVNTASARIYLKARNFEAQYYLTGIAEPLSAMLERLGGKYDSDILYWCWKRLMENFPHDSICGCSVDEVHRKMEVRYTDAIDTAKSLAADVLTELCDRMDTSEVSGKPVAILRTDPFAGSGSVEFEAEYRENEEIPESLALFDMKGNSIPCEIEPPVCRQKFILPYDRFREVFPVRVVRVRLLAENVPGAGYSLYTLRSGVSNAQTDLVCGENFVKNSRIEVRFSEDGTFSIRELDSGRLAENLNSFEEIGDKGNEYNFERTGELHISEGGKARVRLLRKGAVEAVFETVQILKCQSGEPMEMRSVVTVTAKSPLVSVRTEFDNRCNNHRVRAVFAPGIRAEESVAEGQFDFVRRTIKTPPRWKNPDNAQRFDGAVRLEDGEGGFLLSARGLHEYEVMQDGENSLSVTLVRGVAEMGDWFCFPTEDSQCLGKRVSEYAVGVYGAGEKALNETLGFAEEYRLPKLTCAFPVPGHPGAWKRGTSLLPMKREGLVKVSAFKASEDGTGTIVRLFNPGEGSARTVSELPFDLVNLGEDRAEGSGDSAELPAKKIVTLCFKREQ